MAHVQPLNREELPQFEADFSRLDQIMGFLPNSLPTMARRPEIAGSFMALARAVLFVGLLEPSLKEMIAQVASTSAGCRYCVAHCAITAERAGVEGGKLASLSEFEESDLFSDAERAAFRLARDAARVPNASTPSHFDELRKHYSDDEIVEIVATIALFGYLNRWNDTMATQLEAAPLEFASSVLAPSGWEVGKHAATAT